MVCRYVYGRGGACGGKDLAQGLFSFKMLFQRRQKKKNPQKTQKKTSKQTKKTHKSLLCEDGSGFPKVPWFITIMNLFSSQCSYPLASFALLEWQDLKQTSFCLILCVPKLLTQCWYSIPAKTKTKSQ